MTKTFVIVMIVPTGILVKRIVIAVCIELYKLPLLLPVLDILPFLPETLFVEPKFQAQGSLAKNIPMEAPSGRLVDDSHENPRVKTSLSVVQFDNLW